MTEQKSYTFRAKYQITDMFEGKFTIQAKSEKEATEKFLSTAIPNSGISSRYIKTLDWSWVEAPAISPNQEKKPADVRTPLESDNDIIEALNNLGETLGKK